MAIVFCLTAEFGDDRQAAEELARVFRPMRARMHAGVGQYLDDAWRCDVFDMDLYQSDHGTDEDFQRLTSELFETLRSTNQFRFAMVGVDVDLLRTFSEILEEDVADRDSVLYMEGIVLSRTLWSQVGQPEGYEDFSPTHVWRPIRSPLRWR